MHRQKLTTSTRRRHVNNESTGQSYASNDRVHGDFSGQRGSACPSCEQGCTLTFTPSTSHTVLPSTSPESIYHLLPSRIVANRSDNLETACIGLSFPRRNKIGGIKRRCGLGLRSKAADSLQLCSHGKRTSCDLHSAYRCRSVRKISFPAVLASPRRTTWPYLDTSINMGCAGSTPVDDDAKRRCGASRLHPDCSVLTVFVPRTQKRCHRGATQAGPRSREEECQDAAAWCRRYDEPHS